MNTALWAVSFHLLSSNESPQHGMCPAITNAWCKFQKTEAECNERHYDHKHIHHNELKKEIFRDLGDPILLKNVYIEKTPSPNESINNFIWSVIPRPTFVELKILGVNMAIAQFNMSHIAKLMTLRIVILNHVTTVCHASKN
ncbi:uncharacterized protein TNCV_1526131 [Trichonephila clavipes]|nr:uncharacterized protein TNCV_1526131 [Trichonephila clavipes]